MVLFFFGGIFDKLLQVWRSRVTCLAKVSFEELQGCMFFLMCFDLRFLLGLAVNNAPVSLSTIINSKKCW
jgi:hypothetical protein